MNKQALVLALAFILSSIPFKSKAQNGTPDNDFGTNGRLMIDLPTAVDSISCMMVHPARLYLIGGSVGDGNTSAAYLALLNKDGSYVDNFGDNTPAVKFFRRQFTVGTSNAITDIALDADYNIYLATVEGSTNNIRRLIKDASSADPNFNVISFSAAASANFIRKILYHPTDRSLFVLRGFENYSFEIRKYKEDGSPDTDFGTSGVVTHSGILAKSMVITPENTIIVSGNSTFGNFSAFGFAQFEMNGSQSSNIPSGDYAVSSNGCQFTSCILSNDGSIILAGNVFNSSLQMNAAYVKYSYRTGIASVLAHLDYNSVGENVSGLFYDQKGNIISYGQNSDGYGIVHAIKPNGNLDSTFATNGCYTTNVITTINCGVYSGSESRLLFGGNPKTTPVNIGLTKLIIAENPIEFNMLGKTIVARKTESTYYVDPSVIGLKYLWFTNSDSVYIFGKSNEKSYTLYFPENVSNPFITIFCNVTDASGNLLTTLRKSVFIRKEPSLAEQLVVPDCDTIQTRATQAYLNSVAITNGKTLTDSSGASESGYEDFTSDTYDSLLIGQRFSLKLVCPSGNAQYVGAWIDLNNDGRISEATEFVGANYTDGTDSIVEIFNGGIHPQSISGPVRLRVRTRTTGAFSASEFCTSYNDDGETEDYLVLLYEGENTLAPNFITPNNDGKNDYFVIQGIDQSAESNSLKIFDRSGKLVFEMNDYDNSWQGLDESKEQVKPGTYYYLFTQLYKDSNRKFDDVTRGFLEIRY